jgi:uncharacterized protein YbcV (DUF1398 family)
MNQAEIAKAEEMSMQSVAFPQVVSKLIAAGVETYYADLIQLQKTFYGSDRESYVHSIPLAGAGAVAPHFSESDVRSSLVAIQTGKIGYPEFLHQVRRAGTMGYLVFLRGRRALYFGRDGEFHAELFPSSNP